MYRTMVRSLLSTESSCSNFLILHRTFSTGTGFGKMNFYMLLKIAFSVVPSLDLIPVAKMRLFLKLQK